MARFRAFHAARSIKELEMKLKKAVLISGAAAFLGLAGLAATATTASAYVACNRDGDCWHTDARPRTPGVRFDVHPDDWYFHQHWDADKDHHYRDYHEGRGYYRGGVWVTL
jgi:hypothetical protein